MNTLLCCIGRQENQYIREFVEYYKNLGFTNICLYDNNYDGEDNFEDVIGDYIDSGFVILKNYRNQTTCQIRAYEECYSEYHKIYDWIAFFDCDEFLTFTKAKTIEEYLSQDKFKDYNAIKINRMCYGDGGQLRNDGRPLLERIATPVLPYDKQIGYEFPENNHIKTIARCMEIPFRFMGNPHTTNIRKQCTNNGTNISENFITSPFFPFNYDEAYLRHYSTKTIDEYCNKMIKGFPDRKWDVNKEAKFLTETRFFRYNEPTPEKIEIVKDRLGIDLSYLLPQKPFEGEKRKDIQLFMLCYDKKDYDFIDNTIMTPLQCGADVNHRNVCYLKDNTGDNISSENYMYAENTGVYWIWKNVKDAKYKGNCQYRRRFTGIDENTDFDKIFEKYDVICAKPYNYPKNYDYIPAKTVRGGYRFSHCIDDLESMRKVVGELYPEYRRYWNEYIEHGENLYYSSGFIMKAEKYDEYCEFLFNCCSEWIKRNNITDERKLNEHVINNIQNEKYIRFSEQERKNIHTKVLKWQSMIPAFLCERLWTLWVQKNFKPNKRYEVEYDLVEGTRI